jgi:hypothetical protein
MKRAGATVSAGGAQYAKQIKGEKGGAVEVRRFCCADEIGFVERQRRAGGFEKRLS